MGCRAQIRCRLEQHQGIGRRWLHQQLTDEGCSSPGTPGGNGNGPGATCGSPAGAHLDLGGGGGAPFQNFRRDVDLFQVGASIMHVPSGLFAYGLYQHEENNGTQFGQL